MDKKKFSLVVPAYKEEHSIVNNVKVLEKTLKNISGSYEIIVVDDGSRDKTYKEVKKIKSKNLKIYRYEKNQGKGFAVRYGALRAKGELVGFIDAGMDLDPSGLLIALDYMQLHKADIVIGSKLHPDSEVVYPIHRKLISFFYRWMNEIMFGLNVNDTQVGLKIFRKEVVEDVFPRLLVKKFAFDIEILAIANVLGYNKIFESPVKLNFKKNSITNKMLLNIMMHTFWDTLAVYYRIRILRYYRKSNRSNWLDIEKIFLRNPERKNKIGTEKN